MAALEQLTKADVTLLLKFADWKALGVGGDGGDLLSDAVQRTLEMKRHWRRGVSIRNHLLASMRSIASSHLKRELRSVGLSPDYPARAANPETAMDAVELTKRLYRELESKGDSVAIKVLTSILEGLTPKEAQTRDNIDKLSYLAAQTRIRRAGRKPFDGGRQEGSHA